MHRPSVAVTKSVCVSVDAHQIEPLIDVAAAARILGRPEDWVYRKAAAREIPSYKIDGKRQFYASEIQTYIRGHAEGPTMGAVSNLDERRR